MNTEKHMSIGSADTSVENRDGKIMHLNFKQNENEYVEINLLDLFYAMLDKWHYIILAFLLGAVLFNAFAYFTIHPTYKSISKIYVVSSSDDSVVDLSDLNMGTSLTKDYEELILSYPLLNKVIRNLDLDIKYDDLAKLITLTNPSNTRILRITVETKDAQLSCDIANEIAKVATVYLPETMGTIAPNIAQRAILAEEKAGPSYFKYTALGAVLGTMICCIFIFLQQMMDDSIRSAEDLEKHFGLVPLTSIPDSDLFAEENSGKRKKNK